MNDLKYAFFIKSFFIFFLSLFTFFSILNLIVDPYGIHNLVRKEGFNLNKPSIQTHLRMAKAYSVRQLKPQSIILGTSRAEFGLDPSHPELKFQPSYNLNLSGGNAYEMYRYFQHTNEVSNLKQIVLALDFFQFDINNKNSPDFREDRLSINYSGELNKIEMPWEDIFDSLFSLDAFLDSLSTLMEQGERPIYLDNGLIDATTTRRVKLMPITGQRQLFLNNEKRYFNKTYKGFELGVSAEGTSSLENFRLLIAMAYKENLELHILINPAHARQFETIYQSGLWDDFQFWKIQLVKLNEREAALADKKPYPIWDFSGFNQFTTESVPEASDKVSRMLWYWESSHFKTELGNLVLTKVLGKNDRKKNENPFGVLINSRNIESHNEKINADRRRWRENNYQDVIEIESLTSAN